MKVISVVCQKGGAGKTTIATSLAVLAERAGYPTVLFDLDPQATAVRWGDKRDGKPPDVVAAQALEAFSARVAPFPVLINQVVLWRLPGGYGLAPGRHDTICLGRYRPRRGVLDPDAMA
jgi:hypothetical protein